jgi:hypothetical protein
MRKIPVSLVREMRREMDSQRVPNHQQVDWLKWLRYYLDFCHKYHHSTRNPETEILYLQKLSSKGQSDLQQQQASDSISLFREVAKRFPAKGKEQEQAADLSDWGQTLVALEQVLRLRQCARSTSKNLQTLDPAISGLSQIQTGR